jgi:hypothetical protein
VAAVDIEEFYSADERRRRSPELELGMDWRDQHGVRYQLSWVEDTHELYVVREPVPHEWEDPFGGVHFQGTHAVEEPTVEGMTVDVIGTVESRDELDRILDGWEQAMGGPDGVAWLVDRLRSHGVIGPNGPSSPLIT